MQFTNDNIVLKDAEKRLKYKGPEININIMRGGGVNGYVPIIIGALGITPDTLSLNLKELPGEGRECNIQDIVLFGITGILRSVK